MEWDKNFVVELVSAIATSAAVVVALWLAARDRKREDSEMMVRARLHAAAITVRLNEAHRRIDRAANTAYFDEVGVEPNRAFIGPMNDIRAAVAEDLFVPTTDDLLALTPLENHCAHRIARAYDDIAQVRAFVAKEASAWENLANTYTAEQRSSMAIAWALHLNAAADQLRLAVDVCTRAAELGAPTPTGQELYGD